MVVLSICASAHVSAKLKRFEHYFLNRFLKMKSERKEKE